MLRPVPGTARAHFDDDISRARALHALALATAAGDAALAQDLARVSVAFGVGALDAYLCDAFTDTLARCLRICRQNGTAVPAGYGKLQLPIGPLMTAYAARDNWGLRMAARALMARDNMLQVSRVDELLNPSLPPGKKLWLDLAPDFVTLNRKRFTGINRAEYAALTGQARQNAPRAIRTAVLKRIGAIVQRRHNVVHNCDRPKVAKQGLTLGQAKSMLTDVGDFIVILDNHLDAHRVY